VHVQPALKVDKTNPPQHQKPDAQTAGLTAASKHLRHSAQFSRVASANRELHAIQNPLRRDYRCHSIAYENSRNSAVVLPEVSSGATLTEKRSSMSISGSVVVLSCGAYPGFQVPVATVIQLDSPRLVAFVITCSVSL